ncbi:MAG TPA: protein-disulfide reductase DsbD domain-containing protein [Flavitalea sp.]|nr:protein-disulfide reductase DsbD domain-containing protein [Flavitalea sp.]
MKKIYFAAILLIIAGQAFSQIKDPVKWSFSSKKINETTFEVSLVATVDPSWHIYSQTTPDGGPTPTTISFAKNPLLNLEGTAKEVGKLEQKHEPLFGVDVKQFSNKVEFVQTVTLKAKAKTTINGTIEFMTCNNRECLPPTTQSFSVALK